jgi:hypothetical protein
MNNILKSATHEMEGGLPVLAVISSLQKAAINYSITVCIQPIYQ